MNSEEMSEKIVEDLFELGSEPHNPTQRIQFMGGKYPDAETAQGGMGRAALKAFFEHKLNGWLLHIGNDLSE